MSTNETTTEDNWENTINQLEIAGGALDSSPDSIAKQRKQGVLKLAITLEFDPELKNKPEKEKKIEEFETKTKKLNAKEKRTIIYHLVSSELKKEDLSDALKKTRNEEYAQIQPEDARIKMDQVVQQIELQTIKRLTDRQISDAILLDNSTNPVDVAQTLATNNADERAQIRGLVGKIVNMKKVSPAIIAKLHTNMFKTDVKINGITNDKPKKLYDKIKSIAQEKLEIPTKKNISKTKDMIEKKKKENMPYHPAIHGK